MDDKLEQWLHRFDDQLEQEPDDVAGMSLPDFLVILEENEFR